MLSKLQCCFCYCQPKQQNKINSERILALKELFKKKWKYINHLEHTITRLEEAITVSRRGILLEQEHESILLTIVDMMDNEYRHGGSVNRERRDFYVTQFDALTRQDQHRLSHLFHHICHRNSRIGKRDRIHQEILTIENQIATLTSSNKSPPSWSERFFKPKSSRLARSSYEPLRRDDPEKERAVSMQPDLYN